MSGRRDFSREWLWSAEVAVRMYLAGRLTASTDTPDAFWQQLRIDCGAMLGAFSTPKRRDAIADAMLMIVRTIRAEHEAGQ